MGRVSSRLPGATDPVVFTARAGWQRVVDLALKEMVDAVAVAGDVIDASGNYFEAFDPLGSGLRRLSAAGIETFFVAGNHDFDSLPRFFRQFQDPRVHLLGIGAKWERHTLVRGSERLHIDGWSFPAASHPANPLLSYQCVRGGTPVLGLLHTDIEQASSRHAPCSPSELLAAGPTIWLLGHIHRMREWSDGTVRAFYPGSPQALDPGERDAHGAWLVDWPPGGIPSLRHCPLSTIRYEEFALDADGHDDEDTLEAALHTKLEERLLACAPDAESLKILSCRITVCGRTRLHSQLARFGWPNIGDLRRTAHGITALVEQINVNTRPVLDLDTLALGNSPPALLARLLLALDRGEDHPLLVTAHQRIKEAFAIMSIDGDGESGGEAGATQLQPDANDTRVLLLRQGHRILAQLLETRS